MLKKQLLIFVLSIGIFSFSFGHLVEAVSYKYDELNRLIEAQYDDGSLVRYTYDAMGNIVKIAPHIAWPAQTIDDPQKEWKITFSKMVNSNSITGNIYVVDQNNQKVKTEVKVTNDKEVIIKPPSEGYKRNVVYTILITEEVKGKNNEIIKSAVSMDFSVK